jgi:peptidoglycan/xylan/chitin deacetylase (PgdA/CDA1 family)
MFSSSSLKSLPRRIVNTVSRSCRGWLRQGIVLLYHRVAELESDPQLLAVSRKHFDEHLNYLVRNYSVVDLVSLRRLSSGYKVGKPVIGITFDDGYVDNYQNALPILERYHAPATIFATAGMIGRNREFWWDELERIVLRKSTLPMRLEIDIESCRFDYAILDGNLPADLGWDVTKGCPEKSRQSLYLELCRRLKPLEHAEKEKVLDQLRNWAGLDSLPRDGYHAMSQEELRSTIRSGLVSVGGHTMTHPQLSSMSPERQHEEIAECRSVLASMLSSEISAFAYPFGGKDDFNQYSIEAVRAAGYTIACGNVPGSCTARTGGFELPRFLVRNWGLSEFVSHLEAWQIG